MLFSARRFQSTRASEPNKALPPTHIAARAMPLDFLFGLGESSSFGICFSPLMHRKSSIFQMESRLHKPAKIVNLIRRTVELSASISFDGLFLGGLR